MGRLLGRPSPAWATAIVSRSSELASDAGAVERALQTFGVARPAGEAARDIHRHVIAANRESIDMDESSAAKNPHRRGAAAEIDHARCPISLSSSTNTDRPAA